MSDNSWWDKQTETIEEIEVIEDYTEHTDVPRIYKAWKLGNAKGERRFRLHLNDGTTATASYNTLLNTFCDGDTLTLVYSHTIILITGERLECIEDLMMDHKIKQIFCYPADGEPLRNAEETLILSIQFQQHA